MKWVLGLAKLIVLGFWLGVLYFSFIHPLPGKISALLPALAIMMLMLHGIQALLLGLMSKGLLTLTWRHYVSVLLFGFFSMLELRKPLFDAAQAATQRMQKPKSE